MKQRDDTVSPIVVRTQVEDETLGIQSKTLACLRINLKVLLPFQVFVEKKGVKRIVVQTLQGSLGLLPHRLDCAAALPPGILTYETEAEGEVYLAVDQGVMVKTGMEVLVSVRNAIGGIDLDKLDVAVKRQFLDLDAQEKSVRQVLAKMESGFIRRFMEFQHD